MPEDSRPPRPGDIAERVRAARLKAGTDRPAVEGGKPGDETQPSGLGLGMRISIELVTTIAVGGALGYGLDVWMGSAPVAMVVCLFLGGAAGVVNVYRVVKGLDDSVGLGGAMARKSEADARKKAESPSDRGKSDGP